jgi:lipid-A-disaccharide synthase
MAAKRFMLIAGEASGDALAAELVRALKGAPALRDCPFPPEFFGAGGPQMAAEGVELALDLTRHSVIGLSEALKKLRDFMQLLEQLLQLAVARKPDVIICVDFSGFNRRLAHAVKEYVRARRGPFNNWEPRLVQYVSPQVWASRPGRAWKMAKDFDLLLCLLPFERAWYAARVPHFRVEFVGHPIVERHRTDGDARCTASAPPGPDGAPEKPLVLLLPGSRTGELRRHLPPLLGAAERIRRDRPDVRFRMIVPTEDLRHRALAASIRVPDVEVQLGGLAGSLREATVALASTGTVTLECALFGVPTVAFYKSSWISYGIARCIATVKYVAMPNLLAGEMLFPEFLQGAANAPNIARAALELLHEPSRQAAIRTGLVQVVKSLGNPGASARAARAILRLNSGASSVER